jgi:hypothetical protein
MQNLQYLDAKDLVRQVSQGLNNFRSPITGLATIFRARPDAARISIIWIWRASLGMRFPDLCP